MVHESLKLSKLWINASQDGIFLIYRHALSKWQVEIDVKNKIVIIMLLEFIEDITWTRRWIGKKHFGLESNFGTCTDAFTFTVDVIAFQTSMAVLVY